jgi:hypothetical protein
MHGFRMSSYSAINKNITPEITMLSCWDLRDMVLILSIPKC